MGQEESVWNQLVAHLRALLPSCGKNSNNRGAFTMVKINYRQDFFCQESLTLKVFLVENGVKTLFRLKMAFGKLGNGLGSALAIGAAVAVMPDKAEAQDFASYCEPIANGEVLETELTPQNMGYIFDENGRVIGTRKAELTDHYRNGIRAACTDLTEDVGSFVDEYPDRVMLVIYPPDLIPIEIAPETMEAIEANYSQCVAEELAFVDRNQNGRIDEGENANLYRTGEVFCNKELQRSMQHAGRIAASEERVASLNRRQAAAEARMEALTNSIIAGARREVGL